MTNGIEGTPLPGFSTLTPLPSLNMGELPPITVSTLTARTPENTSLTNHASTSANPDPAINPAFIQANYEVLESLLREHRWQMRNEDLRTKLEYYSEEYDKEREVSLLEEAYYQNKLRKDHNKRSNRSTYKLGDFIQLSHNNKDRQQQVWKGTHIVSGVYEGELYEITDASDYSLVQTTKGSSFRKFYI
ncbi:hypothetical protein Tco_0954590 [Tanacetum coccineum]|uniref:Uncharacterized protein n=1 Tax=Tanacetum coccineum TaxID=301880 RepID=A0ABQ5E4U2_9ASTR